MKVRAAVTGLAFAAAAVVPAACAPGAGPGPCTHRYLQAEMAILDALGNVATRLYINEDICITPAAWIVSNTGTQEQHNVGGYAFFDGASLESHPANDAAGTTGPLTESGFARYNPRTFTATWTEDVLAGIAGVGYHIGMGKCTLTGYTSTFLDHIVLSAESGYCTEMRTKLWG